MGLRLVRAVRHAGSRSWSCARGG